MDDIERGDDDDDDEGTPPMLIDLVATTQMKTQGSATPDLRRREHTEMVKMILNL